MTSIVKTRTRLLSTTVLAGVGLLLAAPAFGQAAESMETITVTGYRASLTDSTNAKRASVGFSDAIFAEDIGKFPDTNIAEAFNRIPGITITRENDGSGMRVAIRGLDSNFVKVTLNGAVVSTASTGNTDANGSNREVDLNIFPIELFSKLEVSKTATADQLEGGASGVISMRSLRPFDKPLCAERQSWRTRFPDRQLD
jgi:TonB-dependent receptor